VAANGQAASARPPRSAPRRRARKPWQPYIEATLGFRNHWYLACFSHEVVEGEVHAEELLGEKVLLKRVDGVVYAVEDRCLHRGVALSALPECYTARSVTCWYHGFTYDVRDGSLIGVITDPESPLIGKVAIQSYPVEERKGLVFVFVGDLNPPPPLVEDVPPGLLDEDLAIYPRGCRRVIKSNWRLAMENGIDPAHAYLHRNAELLTVMQRPLALATFPLSREGLISAPEGGPKGIVKGKGNRLPVYEAEIDGVRVAARFSPVEGAPRTTSSLSGWLPGSAKVEGFPTPDQIVFEWYVPIDEVSHTYIQTLGRYVASEREAQQFYHEAADRWMDLVAYKFNNDDILAREQMQPFYSEEGGGWYEERLTRSDMMLTEWRKLATKYNRGIQRRGLRRGSAPPTPDPD
jgi:carbazole 1,9a-dioxygenase terminal dioxygenase component